MGRRENLTIRSDRPVANPVVVLKNGPGDWVILFNPDTTDAVGVNPIGMMVWKLLDGRHRLEDILQAVEGTFAGVPDSVAGDVAAFIDDLAGRGFVGYELEDAGR